MIEPATTCDSPSPSWQRTFEQLRQEMLDLAQELDHLRRLAMIAAMPPRAVEVGDAVLDPLRRELRVEGVPVRLTGKEFELLSLLMLEPGRVRSRESLLKEIWGSSHLGYARSVDAHVNRLRQKLGAAGSRIEGVYGAGYRWNESANADHRRETTPEQEGMTCQ